MCEKHLLNARAIFCVATRIHWRRIGQIQTLDGIRTTAQVAIQSTLMRQVRLILECESLVLWLDSHEPDWAALTRSM